MFEKNRIAAESGLHSRQHYWEQMGGDFKFRSGVICSREVWFHDLDEEVT